MMEILLVLIVLVVSDAVLPILRAAEEQARADTAEQIAQAILAAKPTREAIPTWRAVGIARQYGAPA